MWASLASKIETVKNRAAKKIKENPHRAYPCAGLWRRRWDSNPRALADNRISSAARYDHFDTSPCRKYAILRICHMISSAPRYDRFDTTPNMFNRKLLRKMREL